MCISCSRHNCDSIKIVRIMQKIKLHIYWLLCVVDLFSLYRAAVVRINRKYGHCLSHDRSRNIGHAFGIPDFVGREPSFVGSPHLNENEHLSATFGSPYSYKSSSYLPNHPLVYHGIDINKYITSQSFFHKNNINNSGGIGILLSGIIFGKGSPNKEIRCDNHGLPTLGTGPICIEAASIDNKGAGLKNVENNYKTPVSIDSDGIGSPSIKNYDFRPKIVQDYGNDNYSNQNFGDENIGFGNGGIENDVPDNIGIHSIGTKNVGIKNTGIKVIAIKNINTKFNPSEMAALVTESIEKENFDSKNIGTEDIGTAAIKSEALSAHFGTSNKTKSAESDISSIPFGSKHVSTSKLKNEIIPYEWNNIANKSYSHREKLLIKTFMQEKPNLHEVSNGVNIETSSTKTSGTYEDVMDDSGISNIGIDGIRLNNLDTSGNIHTESIGIGTAGVDTKSVLMGGYNLGHPKIRHIVSGIGNNKKYIGSFGMGHIGTTDFQTTKAESVIPNINGIKFGMKNIEIGKIPQKHKLIRNKDKTFLEQSKGNYSKKLGSISVGKINLYKINGVSDVKELSKDKIKKYILRGRDLLDLYRPNFWQASNLKKVTLQSSNVRPDGVILYSPIIRKRENLNEPEFSLQEEKDSLGLTKAVTETGDIENNSLEMSTANHVKSIMITKDGQKEPQIKETISKDKNIIGENSHHFNKISHLPFYDSRQSGNIIRGDKLKRKRKLIKVFRFNGPDLTGEKVYDFKGKGLRTSKTYHIKGQDVNANKVFNINGKRISDYFLFSDPLYEKVKYSINRVLKNKGLAENIKSDGNDSITVSNKIDKKYFRPIYNYGQDSILKSGINFKKYQTNQEGLLTEDSVNHKIKNNINSTAIYSQEMINENRDQNEEVSEIQKLRDKEGYNIGETGYIEEAVSEIGISKGGAVNQGEGIGDKDRNADKDIGEDQDVSGDDGVGSNGSLADGEDIDNDAASVEGVVKDTKIDGLYKKIDGSPKFDKLYLQRQNASIETPGAELITKTTIKRNKRT